MAKRLFTALRVPSLSSYIASLLGPSADTTATKADTNTIKADSF